MSHTCIDAEEEGYLEEASSELVALQNMYKPVCCMEMDPFDFARVNQKLKNIRAHLDAFEKEHDAARKRVQWSREP